MEMTPFCAAIYRLIRQFVARQELVLAVITDLRPDILAMAQCKEAINDECLQLVKRYAVTPQEGYWGADKEWSYFFHGGGCRLVNRFTGEPLEWDAPNVHEFDRYWFLNYLIWWLGQEAKNEEKGLLSILKEWRETNRDALRIAVFGAISELQKMGLLVQNNPHNPNKIVILTNRDRL